MAIAVSTGGPGAIFWMIMAGFLGMSSKFVECTLGQKYRQTREDGRVMGGAMYYLSNGLKEMNLGGLGKVLGVMFAVLCIGGSFAGGNAFQVNQSLGAIGSTVPFLGENPWIYGLVMAIPFGRDYFELDLPTTEAWYGVAAASVIGSIGVWITSRLFGPEDVGRA